MGKLHTGIFGPSLSGKTVLAKHISTDLYRRHGIKSLVLDPIQDDWGTHSTVFAGDEESQKKFWEKVWQEKRHAVFVDEGTEMISRNEELVPAFTRIRHQGHKLFVIGHRGNSLLPIMRDQISTLFLFRQTEKAAAIWAEQFTNDDIMIATSLKQHEFIWVELYSEKKLVPQKLALGKSNEAQQKLTD
jgi:hypothetical protein